MSTTYAGRPARTESDADFRAATFDTHALRRAWRVLSAVGRPSRVRQATSLTTALLDVRDGSSTLSARTAEAVAVVRVPAESATPFRCLLIRENLPDDMRERNLTLDDLEPVQRGGFGYLLSRVKTETVRIQRYAPGLSVVRVTVGQTRFDLPWFDPDKTFVLSPDLPSDCWEVDAAEAIAAFESVRRCTRRGGSAEDRFAYRNVAFELARAVGPAQVELRLVASDGRLVASCVLPARVAGDVRPDGLLVSASGLRTLALALLALGAAGPVELVRTPDGGLAVRTPEAAVAVCGGAGRFPPWRDAYPKGRPLRIGFDADRARRLALAAECAAGFAGSGPVELHLLAGAVKVYAQEPQTGATCDVGVPEVETGSHGVALRLSARDLHRCCSWAGPGSLDLLYWGQGSHVVLRREGSVEYLLAAYADDVGGAP